MNTSIRQMIALIESLNEVKDIGPMDSPDFDKKMSRSMTSSGNKNIDSYEKIGMAGPLEIWGPEWPITAECDLFLRDSDWNYAGMISLVDNPYFPDSYQIEMTYLSPKFRGKNVGLSAYLFLLSGINLIADSDQTPAARAIWSKIANTPGYGVWVADPKTKKLGQRITDTSVVYGTHLTMIAQKTDED